MIIINVKYQGPTNHRGSRWTATMSAGFSGNKLRATVPFEYGENDGSDEAVKALLRRWDSASGVCADLDWVVSRIGTDHRGEEVFTAYKA